MDIIITGEQGAGKTRAAEAIIKNFRPPYGKRYSDADVLYISDAYWSPPTLLTEMLRAARVRAVVFDGCITTPAEMLAAVAAVKKYRSQIKTDILAIYVSQVDVVMLTDGELVINKFRSSAPGAAFDREGPRIMGELETANKGWVANRSDCILADLWDLMSENVDGEGAQKMVRELNNLIVPSRVPLFETPALHHLDDKGKLALHKFLLTLAPEHE